MKLSKLALLAAVACGFGANVQAQIPSYYSETPATETSLSSMSQVIPASCDCNDAPISSGCCDLGIDGAGGACDGGCDSAGSGPWTLFNPGPCGWKLGGWTNVGYHTANTNRNFNNYDNRVQLQQQWLFAEKVADGSNGLGFGGRMDYLYGTDAPDTQAFGIANNHWDNSWDNGGAYGHAIPQLYGEVAYGKLSAKVGHFFTIVGNEVVAATGNFFYSRQFTFYNSEPFTHTGLLTSYKMDDDTTLWNGYVTGWDSAFEDNGDAYIGGFSRALSDNTSLIYTTTLGRFNNNFGGVGLNERGQLHSMILTYGLSDKLKYINQNDYLHTNDATGLGVRNTFGSIHYLIYQLNDKVGLGTRLEWFNISSESSGVKNADLYNMTYGINYRLNQNMIVRPEVRQVWDKERLGFNENGGSSQTFLGMDGIFTF